MMKGTSTMNDTGASGTRSKVVVIIGAQWGDEGKGRMVDLLCQDADIVCRCQVCNVASVGVKVAPLQQPVVGVRDTHNFIHVKYYEKYRDTRYRLSRYWFRDR